MQRRQARSCEDDAKMPSHVYVQSLASQKPSAAANASSVLKSVSDTHLMSNEASAETTSQQRGLDVLLNGVSGR